MNEWMNEMIEGMKWNELKWNEMNGMNELPNDIPESFQKAFF